jgi:hypothetical protein
MCLVGADEADVQRCLGAQVVDVLPLAEQEARILSAANSLSDYVGDGDSLV